MGCGSSSDSSSALQQQNQQQETNTNKAVDSVNSAFSGFNDAYYQKVQDSYNKWALPQLQTQYQEANNSLGYKLAGQGLLNSSAATQGQNALSAAMTQNQNTIANNAVQQSQNLQQTVGQEKSNLIGQAQSATNPSSFAQSATAEASSIQAPSTYTALGSMFSDFSNQYLTSSNTNTYNQLAKYLSNYTNSNNAFAGGGDSLPSNIY
jgi:hypothetical protein